MTTESHSPAFSEVELRAIDLATNARPGSPAPDFDAAIVDLRAAGGLLGRFFDAIRIDSGHHDIWPSYQAPTLFECEPTWRPVPGHADVHYFLFGAPFGTSNITLDTPALDRHVTHDGDDHYTAVRIRLEPNLLLEFRDHEWVDNMACQMDVRGALIYARNEAAMEAFIATRPTLEASEKLAQQLAHVGSQGLPLDGNPDTARLHDGGRSAAHIAAEYGDVHNLALLIRHGADVRCLNWLGESPLHKAVTSGYPGAEDTVELLCRHTVDIDEQNLRGETALHRAVLFDKIAAVKILLDNGANPHAKDRKGQTPENLAATLGSASAINMAKVFSSWRAQQAVTTVLKGVRLSA